MGDSYNKLVASAFADVKTLKGEMNNERENIAALDTTINESKTEKKNAYQKLEDLNDAKINLGKQCNFLLENFETRQEGMKQEIEAITGAKAILSGAVFE